MTLIELLSKILDIAFSGFWAFWGITILLAMAIGVLLAPIGLLFRCWNRVFRHLNINHKDGLLNIVMRMGTLKTKVKMGKLENKAWGCILTPIVVLLILLVIGLVNEPSLLPVTIKVEQPPPKRDSVIVPDRPHIKYNTDSMSQLDRIEDALYDIHTR